MVTERMENIYKYKLKILKIHMTAMKFNVKCDFVCVCLFVFTQVLRKLNCN